MSELIAYLEVLNQWGIENPLYVFNNAFSPESVHISLHEDNAKLLVGGMWRMRESEGEAHSSNIYI